MTLRKIIVAIVIAVVGVLGWFAYGVIHTLRHIPEAYAAWDTGTLLVEYMKAHEDRWPTSWDDLLMVLNSEAGTHIPLRGSQAGDLPYARSLREKIAVDWRFDPAHPGQKNPVSRPDGTPFPVVWEEPNEMVRDYLNLKRRNTTGPAETQNVATDKKLDEPSAASLRSAATKKSLSRAEAQRR